MSIETNIKFFWDCSRSLAADNQTHKLLKSNYMNICRNISKNTLQIPKEKFALSQMCPFCSTFWIENEFSLKLNSQQVANNSKTSKLLEMLDNSKDVYFKSNLSRKQINRAKWLKKRVTNSVAINCHHCKHKSLVKMEKPESKIKKTNDEKNTQLKRTDIYLNDQMPKPKTNKIKCERSGLKTPHKKKTELNSHLKNIKTIIPTPQKKSKILHSRPHGRFVNPQSPNEPSKTQKQNSVLQLATLLKNQSSSNAKNLAEKRLEALLK